MWLLVSSSSRCLSYHNSDHRCNIYQNNANLIYFGPNLAALMLSARPQHRLICIYDQTERDHLSCHCQSADWFSSLFISAVYIQETLTSMNSTTQISLCRYQAMMSVEGILGIFLCWDEDSVSVVFCFLHAAVLIRNSIRSPNQRIDFPPANAGQTEQICFQTWPQIKPPPQNKYPLCVREERQRKALPQPGALLFDQPLSKTGRLLLQSSIWL